MPIIKATESFVQLSSLLNQGSFLHLKGLTTGLRSELTVSNVDRSKLSESLNAKPSATFATAVKRASTLNLPDQILYCGLEVNEKPAENGRKRTSDDQSVEGSVVESLVVVTSKQLSVYDVQDPEFSTVFSHKLRYEILDVTSTKTAVYVLSKKQVDVIPLDGKKGQIIPMTGKNPRKSSKILVDSEENIIFLNYDSRTGEMAVHVNNDEPQRIQISVGDAADKLNELEKVEASRVHQDLVFIKFTSDAYHLYVYSISQNKLSHRLNCQSEITSFVVFKLRNLEFVLTTSDDNVVLYKCIFRKNAVNLNPTTQMDFKGLTDKITASAVVDGNVVSVIGSSKFVIFNVDGALSSKAKSNEVNVEMVGNKHSSEVKSITKDMKKLGLRRKKKVIITGNETIDQLLREFKIVKTDVYNLIAFCMKNNNNLKLIIAVLKNSRNEEVDQILSSFLKTFENDDNSFLSLGNWVKMILIFNGNFMIKNSNKKRVAQLKKFQSMVQEHNSNLSTFLALQGKLTLLQSQHELRKTSEMNESSNDSDDEQVFTKSQNQLLQGIEKGSKDSMEGVQLIEEDDLVYENGEVDEEVDDDE